MSALNPWTREIIKALKDHEWHPLHDFVGTAASTVPPGRAARRAGGKDPRAYIERNGVGTAAYQGKRTTVLDALRGHVRSGWLERREGPDGPEYRLTPDREPPVHKAWGAQAEAERRQEEKEAKAAARKRR